MRQTRGSETSQYPEEEKSNEILPVAARERGIAQTDPNTKKTGTRDRGLVKDSFFTGSGLPVPSSGFFVLGLG